MSLFESASLVVTPNGTKASKLYAVKPVDGSGDLTVTRATTATRVNSAGLIESVAVNVPRLDYTNSTCPSILVEPQRTNNFTYSEQFDNIFWVKALATVTANDTISPSGDLNADRVSFNSGTINSTVTVLANTTYTISFFAKKGTASTLRIAEAYWDGRFVDFDLNTGTVTSGTGKIEDYGNGWYRCSMQFTYGIGQTIASWVVRNFEAGYIYLWGGTLEAGSYATSYIPTVASAVTRNADVISKTGISSLIGQTEGTIYADVNITIKKEDSSPVVSILTLNNNVTNVNNAIVIGIDRPAIGTVNQIYAFIINGGTEQVVLNTSAITNGRYKIAFAYKQNDFAFYVNGVLIGTDTSGNIPTCNQVLIGERFNSDTFKLADSVNSALIYKTRLTNAELAELTTL